VAAMVAWHLTCLPRLPNRVRKGRAEEGSLHRPRLLSICDGVGGAHVVAVADTRTSTPRRAVMRTLKMVICAAIPCCHHSSSRRAGGENNNGRRWWAAAAGFEPGGRAGGHQTGEWLRAKTERKIAYGSSILSFSSGMTRHRGGKKGEPSHTCGQGGSRTMPGFTTADSGRCH